MENIDATDANRRRKDEVMKNVQIPYELFVSLLRYHLMEDNDCLNEIRQGLEQKWIHWCAMNYMQNIRLRPHRKIGKKPDRNIWINVECRTVSDGSFPLRIINRSVPRSCG